MTELALILVSAILVNNFVLVQFLGLCPFMGVSRKIETAIGLSLATTFVLTLAAMCSHILQRYVLRPLDLEYLRTIGFILVIAVVVQFTEMLVKKTSPLLYRVLGIFLPLITTNRIVLGVALLNANKAEYGFLQATTQGFGAGLGFSLVLVLFAALRERIAIADVPAPFRGAAIGMITAGLMSLAFMGFSGLVRHTACSWRSARCCRSAWPAVRCSAMRRCASASRAIRSPSRSTPCCRRPSAASVATPAASPTPRRSPPATRSTSARRAAKRPSAPSPTCSTWSPSRSTPPRKPRRG